jgi:hypothetical protein
MQVGGKDAALKKGECERKHGDWGWSYGDGGKEITQKTDMWAKKFSSL